MSKNNPANDVEGLPKGYRPMSAGRLRLEVPEKEGFHRHWFRGTASRIRQAQQAGYRFVDPSDETVDVSNFDLGGDDKDSGSSDLGSRISVVSGDDLKDDGQPSRLYLMECPMHIYEHAQHLLGLENARVADAMNPETSGDPEGGKRYIKGSIPALFTPKPQRRT